MSFWESFYLVATIVSAISSALLLAWFFYDVFWRHGEPRTGGRYEPDREQLRKLQAKRRQALRNLGDKWVLHDSRPAVKWGYRHE
jgi:hypothetical protein